MPLGADVGANIKELRESNKHKKKKRKKKQILAIALEGAREAKGLPSRKGLMGS